MGIFEIVGIAVFALIGGLLYLAENDSLTQQAKRGIAAGCIALFAIGGITLFLVEDTLGDFAPPPSKKKAKGAPKDKAMVGVKLGGDEEEEGKTTTYVSGTGEDGMPKPKQVEIVHVDDGKAKEDDFGASRDCDACPLMVSIPAGKFEMGSPSDEPGRRQSESPQMRIKLDPGFAIGRYEIMREEYHLFVEETGHKSSQSCMVSLSIQKGRSYLDVGFKQGRGHPVTCVSMNDAIAYIKWLSKKSGKAYRLPSEAEWEYAARAGSATAYHFGEAISKEQGRFDAMEGTNRAGQYPPNRFALHDMHGNVAEMVSDCWQESLRGLPLDGGPRQTGACNARVLKGGAWYDPASELRSAARLPVTTTVPDNGIGFRVVRD